VILTSALPLRFSRLSPAVFDMSRECGVYCAQRGGLRLSELSAPDRPTRQPIRRITRDSPMNPLLVKRFGLRRGRWASGITPHETRRLVVLVVLLVGLVQGFAPWSPAQAAQARQYPNTIYLPLVVRPASTVHPYTSRVVELVNQERARVGCLPLAMNTALNNAALGHSEDMARNDFFDHTGSDGSSPWDRMTRAGYQWSGAGENIAAGYASPEAAVSGWMGSAGHRANILNCSFRDTGVGYIYLVDDTGQVNYHHYWTQVFGAPR